MEHGFKGDYGGGTRWDIIEGYASALDLLHGAAVCHANMNAVADEVSVSYSTGPSFSVSGANRL